MITDLETLLNQDEFKKLVEAINKNQEYNLSDKGLTIKANSTDDSLFLSVSYERQKEEDSLIKEEIKVFKHFLDELDNELFVDLCEYIGNEELKKIQTCLDSNSLETVRAGITKFKTYLSKYSKNIIEYYQKYV